jgi:hypothetical protein
MALKIIKCECYFGTEKMDASAKMALKSAKMALLSAKMAQ